MPEPRPWSVWIWTTCGETLETTLVNCACSARAPPVSVTAGPTADPLEPPQPASAAMAVTPSVAVTAAAVRRRRSGMAALRGRRTAATRRGSRGRCASAIRLGRLARALDRLAAFELAHLRGDHPF